MISQFTTKRIFPHRWLKADIYLWSSFRKKDKGKSLILYYGDRLAKMIDITDKSHVFREAKATGTIELQPETVDKIRGDEVPKGDVLSVARAAGILAVKNTPQIVPLTHPIPITGIDVDLNLKDEGISVKVNVKSRGQTGVEMEALSGVSAVLLTIWDMVKGFEKSEEGQYPNTRITDIQIQEKVKEE